MRIKIGLIPKITFFQLARARAEHLACTTNLTIIFNYGGLPINGGRKGMGESVVKTIDSQGRLIIPAEMRKDWKSDKVMVIKDKDEIRIVPLETLQPSELFDSIKVDDDLDLTDSHTLMKALRRKASK
jgi:bifunctional DNA-binding transcriptional regulator/antitoxin component of YhaV-PrlF toxin-antitoxin module